MNEKYGEILSKLIKKSNLTLRQIADRCNSQGLSIDPSYISKLKNGKQPPPSDEISQVLSSILDDKAKRLVWAGYLDKTPSEIRSYFENTAKFLAGIIKEIIRLDYIEQFDNDEGFLLYYESLMEDHNHFDNLIELLNDMQKTPTEEYVREIHANEEYKMFKGIQIMDDSLEPLIPKGSSLVFIPSHAYCDGDYVLTILGDKSVIRRYYSHNESIILIANNPKYPAKIYKKDGLIIRGKAVSVKINLL